MPTTSIMQEEEPGRSPCHSCAECPDPPLHPLSFLCVQARARPLPPRSNQHPCPMPEAPTCVLGVAPAAPGSTRSASTSATWTSSG